MLHGVEHSRGPVERRPSAFFNAPAASAFAIVFGAVGYLLVTRTTTGIIATFIIAIVSAAAATTGAIILLSKWALPHSGNRGDNDEKIQGVFARVTRAISPSKQGEIVFEADGVNHTLVAESNQETEIPRDAEVVIDTVRNGVAQVELWSAVEQRL